MIKTFTKCMALTMLATLIGCTGSTGPELGQVSGSVSIDGAPAPNVTVKFDPIGGGRGSTGVTDSNGNYTLVYSPDSTGAVIGQHNVSISSEAVLSDDNLDLSTPQGSIPTAYLSMTKEARVDGGKNTIDLVYP